MRPRPGRMARAAPLLLLLFPVITAEILTPPYFNLATGKKITATATCGDEGPELYCKLVGANADHDEHVIQGQVCDICDATNEFKKHPPEYAVDGRETWWQSPPLSRGMKYNEVTLTIDLGQEFHVAYVFVRMGNSPRPGLWVLEKSTDYGKTYKPWMYFSDSPQDCERYFGKESIQPITKDDSVICSTEYSKIVPLEGGEIPISLLNYRPSANMYFNSSVLQEWTRATNVRLRFLRTKNLLGHLMSVARQDPTVTRRYFYSIKDISIGGRCMCNGHADTCDPADPNSDTNILVCRCQHNTCGPQCAQCCPGFEQKKWRISQNWDRFACEPCNCHNHTTECTYDPEVDEKRLSLDIHGRYEGGGVCKNCQHNTMGINCNQCQPTYYRPYGKTWGEIDVCQPCNCNPHFSTGNCAEETGQCECRPEFNPPNCDSCAYGYFDYPNCKPCTCNLNGTDGQHCTPTDGICPCKFNYAGKSCEICEDGYYSPECKNCECNSVGSVSHICDKVSGNCTCKSKYAGRTCNMCEAGYYNYPTCKHCNCDVSGTEPNVCDDVTGQCICKAGFGGPRCDQCIPGYYMEVRGRERVCSPCSCDPTGSTSTSCSADGKCNCLVNFGGKQCNQCSPGFYKYPDCMPCNCDVSGSIGSTCDDTGLCHCKANFDGVKCDRCREQFYNYPACEECNCDPRGVAASFAGCGSVPAGELCQCKDRVQGRICNDCKPLFWNLQDYNPYGCEECYCHLPGTLGGLGACNTRSGQCTCKSYVDSRTCDQCRDGFYRLQSDNVFGCTPCDCDVGGSIDNNCDKVTGQCRCHSRVEGRRCDRPIRAHYFPTLHQFQYEVEDGVTQSGPVRYRNSEDVFPGYSWKGYVVFSMLQNEVINIVMIQKSSLYRMVLKYANPLQDPVQATIIITPESVVDIQQKYNVLLRPTHKPQLVTVTGDKGITPAPFVMNPGNWTVTIKTTKEIMIDYFVLIPEAYYEATVLTKLVDKPCVIGDNSLCRHFAYPSLEGRPVTNIDNLVTSVTGYVDNSQQLEEINAQPNTIPLLSDDQSELQYNMDIDPTGPYVLVLEYVTPVNPNGVAISYDNATDQYAQPKGIVIIRFQSGEEPESTAVVTLNDCPYTTPCRQVIADELSKVQAFNVQDPKNVINLMAEPTTLAGIKSIVAIPESDWHLDYITPRPYCLRRNGKCEPAIFSAAIDSKKFEIESGTGGDRETQPPILDNSTAVVYLTPAAGPVVIEGKVPTAGNYMLVLHYYQPDLPEFNIDATILADGVQSWQTTIPVNHCPSNSGCRALFKLYDGNTKFPIEQNFTITFKELNSKGVWLDYVLVIAESDYIDSVLTESNILDYTREFIKKCAVNDYYIGVNETGFCRDAMFSITAEYNSGALSCFCDFMGSTELECDTFGGQCPCKPNVIGRSCSICRTGYYGFPNCRPCHCPSSAICDDNGMCICPKNVEGENCDRCKKYTFNFDEFRGCDDCNCNALGVINNQLQCEQDSGNCACRDNVIGRVCDHCVPGHYAFPDCVPCSCDLDGTTDDVCDQNTAQCYCKKHVRGQECNVCKEEYFNLQADNPDGCTKCFCFGKTARCSSSYLAWAAIDGMSHWYMVNIDDSNRTLNIFPRSIPPSFVNETVIVADLIGEESENKVAYFGAPEYFLGKRLTSYGGYLTYSVLYTTNTDGHAIGAADVIIGGPQGYLVHNSIEQPPSSVIWTHALRLTEEEFTTIDGTPVTRDQFMHTLVNVSSIYIRATYWHETIETSLISVSLDVGVEDFVEEDSNKRASSVEECQCPKAYRGLSCEQCAEGHYRLPSGFCVPCQCNGHATQCDVNTGICLDCMDNTMGDHCEMCIPGYHGDATVGTRLDCLICACPMPYPSNNFAIGCDLSENGSLISCQCKEGYAGARCEYCAAGFYGEPESIGDTCKPCNCSGNINPKDPSSCDSITGDCLKCVNNTAGAACNLCAPGFYGDAIFSKNCTACICDEFGMERCDPSTGTCVCRPGVVGEKCDRCAPDHWGINSGEGCTPCDCGLASESTQCDDNTGQCRCAKGVTGRHCDQCAAGYWNYTKEGCDHCNCNTGYSVGFMCSATGQCECLPGVVGEKCDHCPERWVLIPHEGCLECDSCTDALIFSVQDLSYLLSNETMEFKDKADSFFTTQRLNYISNQTKSLWPRLSELHSVDVEDAESAVKALETAAKNLLRSAEFGATDSDKQITRAAVLAADAVATLDSAREISAKAKVTVAHVADLATGLELSQQPKVDSALIEANQIKNDISAKDLSPKKLLAESAFTNATKQIERMNVFVEPVKEQTKKFESLVNSTHDLKDKVEEMFEYTDQAQEVANAAEKLNAKNRQSKFGNKVLSVTKLNADAMKDLINAAYDIGNATYNNIVVGTVLTNSTAAAEDIDMAIREMDQRLLNLADDLPQLQNLSEVANMHTKMLRNRADNLRTLAERENNNTRTQHAYAAASAYSSIVQEIGDAKKAADDAEAAVQNVTNIDNILSERVSPALTRSESLLENAAKAQKLVESNLRPNLTRADEALANATGTLASADDDNKAIQLSMNRGVSGAFSLIDESQKADNVNATIKRTKDTMSQLGPELDSSKEWAQTLPKLADEGQKMSLNVESLVNNINGMKPEIMDKYNQVKSRQDDLEHKRKEADEKLKKLRDLIEQARTVANRIQVGVTFNRWSTLQPRLPESVDEMSTSTHVSAYFRTKEKDGFILYLGNPKDTKLRRTKSDDFMVIGIQKGYPYLVMDIGDSAESGREPARISSDKYVADNRWYQVIVDRVGRNVKLSIRESLDNGSDITHSKEAVLPGQHTIFNLDRDKSKLYVGGVPSDAKLQGISFPAFEGLIEELMIGDTPVGLWNFVNATNLEGARQRDKLISSQSGPQEYRFNGRSHVTVPGRGYLTQQKNHVLLFFRTYAPDGLIYLVGENGYFFSIQMQDGKVFLQVSLGNPDELLIIGTTKSYNDGKWHKLDAGRYLTKCSLRVDDEIVKGVAPALATEIAALDTMNFGGNNKDIIQVTRQGFDGCIRQISIDGVNIDFSDNVESIGVAYGCQFASLVSLSGQDSYLRFVDITTDNLQLTLKFKTSKPDGLLFVYVSRTQTATTPDSISLSLVKGKLVLMSQREQLDTGISTYNDSQWHVVTVTHNENALRLVVDDFDYFSTDTAPAPLHILDGVLFIGGVQPGYVVGGKLGSKAAFEGCIADATLNGRVLNLLGPFSNSSITFGRCGTTTTTGGVNPDEASWSAPQNPDVLPTPAPQPIDITTVKVQFSNEIIPPFAEPSTTQAPFMRPGATGRPPSTTRRPPPSPQPGCALAYDPYYTIGDPDEGYRFGTRNDSRIEYSKLPGRQLEGFDLTVTFRTFDVHGGLIFYAQAEKDSTQFFALYMKDARLHCAFNSGSGPGQVSSEQTYNDTEWHTATVVRSCGHVKLAVDSEKVAEHSFPCGNQALLTPPYYYGGLKDFSDDIVLNIGDFYQPFKGCLKGLMMNGQRVTDISMRVNSLRCTDNVENGVYFGASNNAHSNYLKLLENFKVGDEISISMEVRPRNSTGLLLSVHGKKDYLVLEMLGNEVAATVENGNGPFRATYKLTNNRTLCDGTWHKIHVVKSMNVVSVGLDGHFSKPGIGARLSSTDTRSALYIGGHERPIHKVRGVRSKRGFTGCLRNLTIGETSIQIPITAPGRNTHIGVCPVE